MATPRDIQKKGPISRFGKTGYQFDPLATEVAILDRSGRAIWKKSKRRRTDSDPLDRGRYRRTNRPNG